MAKQGCLKIPWWRPIPNKKTKSLSPRPFEICVTGITASHRAESIYIDGAELSEFI